MKMLVELDAEKIRHEGRYDLAKMENHISRLFEKRGMKLDAEHWYANGNFSSCGALTIILSRTDWFMDNVKQWLWLDTEDGSIEDVKAQYRKEPLRA